MFDFKVKQLNDSCGSDTFFELHSDDVHYNGAFISRILPWYAYGANSKVEGEEYQFINATNSFSESPQK